MPGAPRNCIADMGLDKVRELVQYCEQHRSRDANNGMGCLLFVGSAQTDEYGQVSYLRDLLAHGRTADELT